MGCGSKVGAESLGAHNGAVFSQIRRATLANPLIGECESIGSQLINLECYFVLSIYALC